MDDPVFNDKVQHLLILIVCSYILNLHLYSLQINLFVLCLFLFWNIVHRQFFFFLLSQSTATVKLVK